MSNFKRNVGNEEFKSATFWLNVGVVVDGKTVTLPVGIPLAEETKTRGAEQASLLQSILEMARQVPKGSQQELAGLQLFVRHVDDAPAEATNLGLKLKLK